MPKRCGAKTRAGGHCQAYGMANGRCRVHGGPTPKGQRNAWKHGFYSDALKPEEQELFRRAPIGSLDDEIRLMRVKLHRLVRLSGDAEVAELVESALEVARKFGTELDDDGKLAHFDRNEIKVKAPQYADLIISALEQLRKLELARYQLAGGMPDDGDDDDGAPGVRRIIVEVVGGRPAPADDGAAG